MLLVGAGTATSTRDVEDGYAQAFRELGVDLYLYALEARLDGARRWLSQQWLRRGRPAQERPSWPDAIYRGSVEALEMALRFDVDWVVVISAMFLHPDVLGMLRRAGIKTAVLFTESPYEDLPQLRVAQLSTWSWTMERSSTRTLRAGYLPHAYDPARHYVAEADASIPAHDVVFVGTGFIERCETLAAIDWTGIDLGLYGEWGLLGSRSKLREFVRGGLLSNAETIALYRRASIGLNLFRTSAVYGRHVPHFTRAESANPRTFELAACGVFQVSDVRPEIGDLFGSSIPTATGPADMESLIRRALGQPEWRQQCADQARQRVAPHTYAARAAQALTDLEHLEQVQARGA
jgi:spore maturation protein CgeB